MSDYEGVPGWGDREDSLKELQKAINNLRKYLDHIESYAEGLLVPVTIFTISGRIRDSERHLRVWVQNDIGEPPDPVHSDTPQV